MIEGIVKDRMDRQPRISWHDRRRLNRVSMADDRRNGRCAFAPCLSWTNERENKSGGRNEWDEGEEGEAAFEDLVRIRR